MNKEFLYVKNKDREVLEVTLWQCRMGCVWGDIEFDRIFEFPA